MQEPVSFTDIYVDESIADRVDDVLRSKRYVKGPMVEQFESAFGEFCGTDHAIGVASGTDAIYLALKAADISSGDDVLVPGHSFFATVSPILELGANPVFVDVDPVTYTMGALDLEEKVRQADNPAAILPVHIYGHPAEMHAISNVADKYGLTVIEDACQAHGATYQGERAGSLGDIGCFSFYPSKNMTVAGDGGMLVTDDDDIAATARELRNHGRNEDGEHIRLGLNHRMSELHAAVGYEQLELLPEWNEKRRRAAARYTERLSDIGTIKTPAERTDAEHVYHLYVIHTPDRDELQDQLESEQIETGIHYPTPLHRQPAVRAQLKRCPELTRTEILTDRILSLPMHPRITDEEIDRVCAEVEEFYDR